MSRVDLIYMLSFKCRATGGYVLMNRLVGLRKKIINTPLPQPELPSGNAMYLFQGYLGSAFNNLYIKHKNFSQELSFV